MTESLPGYDAWKLASPPEGPRTCTCGHDYDDHAEPEFNDYREVLEQIVTLKHHIRACANRECPNCERLNRLLDKAEELVAVCQVNNCLCRKFEAA